MYINKGEWTETLKNKIKDYDVISFDIFDTLIKRDCSDFRNIFKLVGEKIFTSDEEIENFISRRYYAELDLYKKNPPLIPTINDIYDNMNIDSELKKQLIESECDTEIQYACVNKVMYDIYLECKKLGKKICAISDMYLPSDTLKKILEKCGYTIDEIWVSCEKNANKSSGELFRIFMKDIGVSPKEIIHIGDNNIADIKGAKKCGINSFLIPRELKNTTYFKKKKSDFGNDILYSFINDHIVLLDSRIKMIGFETLGPMVYGFCQWLHLIKKEYKIDKLLFCARDVYQTMEIYKMLYPEETDDVEYLCVSLKSLKAPYEALIGKDKSEESKLQLQLIKKYFEQLGCDGKKIAMVDSGCGGHTQSMIKAILGESSDFHGLYMRISKNFHKNIQDKESFPYMFKNKPSAKSFISGAFFETMLSATHGRTLKYTEDENGVVLPVFGDDNPQEKLLREFQYGIEYFVKEWCALGKTNMFISSEMVENAFLNFSFFPLETDVDLLSDITGGNESYMGIVLKNEGKQHFFMELRDTYWKGGYLCKKFKKYKWICKVYLFVDTILLNLRGF